MPRLNLTRDIDGSGELMRNMTAQYAVTKGRVLVKGFRFAD